MKKGKQLKAQRAEKEAKRKTKQATEADDAHLWGPVVEDDTKDGEDKDEEMNMKVALGRMMKSQVHQRAGKGSNARAKKGKMKAEGGGQGKTSGKGISDVREMTLTETRSKIGTNKGQKWDHIMEKSGVSSFYVPSEISKMLAGREGERALKTVFAPISQEEVEAKRKASRLPLQRDENAIKKEDAACFRVEIPIPCRPRYSFRFDTFL